MNQDQKKYFRQRIDAAVQSKILELNLQVQKLDEPEMEPYLIKKNFKPNMEALLKCRICNYSKVYFDSPDVRIFFDLTEYDKRLEYVEMKNGLIEKARKTVADRIKSDADKVIDYVMFADEKEALKQLEAFQKKVYKV